MFEHSSRFEIAQLSLDEGAKVARRAVLDLEDNVKLIIVLDEHARAHLCGGNRHRGYSSLLELRAVRKEYAVWPVFIVADRRVWSGPV